MRRLNWAGMALVIAGCSNVDTSMTVLGAAAPDDSCEFEVDGDEYATNFFFDAVNAETFALTLRVRNDLQGQTINLGSADLMDNYTIPAEITPLRMDFRFECDTNGFSDELGPLYVPQFSTDDSFCQQKDVRRFQGFDVVPAAGATIPPNGGIGLVLVKPITTQLAHAFGETLDLAVTADRCCNSFLSGGCNDENLRDVTSNDNTPCGQLQRDFEKVAKDSLSATRSDDIERFRPYAVFDWVYSNIRQGSQPPDGRGPGYPLRLRGVLEGVTGDGSIVSSTEYWEIVNLCANCNNGSKCTTL